MVRSSNPVRFSSRAKTRSKNLDSQITYRGIPAWMLNRLAPTTVCSRWRKLAKLDPPSDLKKNLSPKIDSSFHRLLIIDAFVIYRIGNDRERANDHAVKIGPITERRIAFPASQLSLVEI